MEEIISLKNIKFEYKNKMIFDDLSYSFTRGRYIIQGENGGGKTTLLNLLYGYLEPESGEIKKKEKLHINYLFQDTMLFNNLTVKENILIKCIAINQGECETLIEKYAQKYSLTDKLDKEVSLLSGGERQRVQLAILSCSKSDVILLDEPIAFLDFPSKVSVLKMLETVAKTAGKSVLLSIHDIEIALQMAQRLWVLSDHGFFAGEPHELAREGKIDFLFSGQDVVFDRDTLQYSLNRKNKGL